MAAASNSLGLELFKKFCNERFLSDAKAQPEKKSATDLHFAIDPDFALAREFYSRRPDTAACLLFDEFHSLIQNEPEQQVDDMFS